MHRDDRGISSAGKLGIGRGYDFRRRPGRVTRDPARNAFATTDGETSVSGRLRSSITTWSGITATSASEAWTGSNEDVESVTTATPADCSA